MTLFVRLSDGQPVEQITAAAMRRIIREHNPLAHPPKDTVYLTVPEELAGDYAQLFDGGDPVPELAYDQRAVQSIQLIAGQWNLVWATEQLSPEEAAAEFERLRAAAWERVKTLREQHAAAGVTVPGLGSFDSDPNSCLKLNGATTAALLAQMNSQPYSVRWTLQDNSEVELGAAQIMGVGLAVAAHVASCHDRSKDLRALIDAAVSPAELEAIDVEAGWP